MIKLTFSTLRLDPAASPSLFVLLPGGDDDFGLAGAGLFSPSKILTNRIFVGSSVTCRTGTCSRHSGHRSSLRASIICCKHLIQNVCWQGKTRLVTSSFSKHTEHSGSTSRISDCFSIVSQHYLACSTLYLSWWCRTPEFLENPKDNRSL